MVLETNSTISDYRYTISNHCVSSREMNLQHIMMSGRIHFEQLLQSSRSTSLRYAKMF